MVCRSLKAWLIYTASFIVYDNQDALAM